MLYPLSYEGGTSEGNFADSSARSMTTLGPEQKNSTTLLNQAGQQSEGEISTRSFSRPNLMISNTAQ